VTWFAQSANETEAARGEGSNLVIAVDFDFPSGHVRAWAGYGDLIISGNTFLGTGDLGKIVVIPERVGLDAQTKSYELAGIDWSLIPQSELDNSFGRSVTEYVGFFNSSMQLVDTPEINFEGRVDTCNRVDGPQPVIRISVEHRLVLLDRPDGWKSTNSHQQQFYPGDTGFDQVAAIQTKTLLWGGQQRTPGFGPGRGHLPQPTDG
jgi:hypothetical protein